MPATTGMKGAGFYDQHSTPQLIAIQALQDWLSDAVAHVPLPDSAQPVAVLDLGSSEGRNAVRIMASVAAQFRQRTPQPIQTIYSDLASNNFNQLYVNLEELRRTGVFPEGVYASAAGGSFYGPLLPPGTVHLATCFNAILWMDHLPPVPLPDHVSYRRPHPPRPGPAVPPEAVAAFTQQAQQDLRRFLECRARELVPGGKLLVASPGDSDQARVSDGLYDVLNDACLDLVAAGRLQREQYERLIIPVYFRTLEELLAPLQQDGSPVCDAFTIDRAETMDFAPPFLEEFRCGGDVAAYASAYTGFLRAFSEPVVRAAFHQSAGEDLLVESLYEGIRARLNAEPERYAWRYIQVAALLTRR